MEDITAAEGNLEIKPTEEFVQELGEVVQDIQPITPQEAFQAPAGEPTIARTSETGSTTGTIFFNSESNMIQYTGAWKANKFSGHGIAKYKGSESYTTYEGDWENGLFHGQGKLIYPSGLIFKGEFAEGLKNGKGTYEFTDAPQKFSRYAKKYSGNWSKDIWQNGNLVFEKMASLDSDLKSNE